MGNRIISPRIYGDVDYEDIIPVLTNGGGTVNGSTNTMIRFDDSSDDETRFNFGIVKDYIKLSRNPILYWKTRNTSADVSAPSSYDISLRFAYKADGEEYASSTDYQETDQSLYLSAADKSLQTFSYEMDGSLMSIGDMLSLNFRRLASSGSDGRNGNMDMLDIWIRLFL